MAILRSWMLVLLCLFAAADRASGGQVNERAWRGRVIDAVSGRAISEAVVVSGPSGATLLPSNGRIKVAPATQTTRTGQPVITDASGMFVMEAGAEGTSLHVRASGYLDGAYGQMWPGGPAIAIGRAATHEDLAVRLWPTGAIAGRVVSPTGKPLQSTRILAIPLAASPVVQLATGLAAVYTDTDGRFELRNLVPGRYLVCVLSQIRTTVGNQGGPQLTRPAIGAVEGRANDVSVMSDNVPVIVSGGRTLVPSDAFYRSADKLENADIVSVMPGVRVDIADLEVGYLHGYVVSGRLNGPYETVARGLGVRIVRDGNEVLGLPEISVATTRADRHGNFIVRGVPQGNYQIRASAEPPAREYVQKETSGVKDGIPYVKGVITALPTAPPRTSAVYGSMPLAVVDEDVKGLAIDLLSMAAIEGDVVEADGSQTTVASGGLQLLLRPVSGIGQVRLADVVEGRFRLEGVAPGGYSLEVRGRRGVGAIVRVAGDDVTDATFGVGLVDVPVKVSLPTSVTAVSGRVTECCGEAVARAFMFPSDRRLWNNARLGARNFVTADIDAGGTFLFGQVPAGQYILVAVKSGVLRTNWLEADSLEALAGVGKAVSIGGERSLVFTVSASSIE